MGNCYMREKLIWCLLVHAIHVFGILNFLLSGHWLQFSWFIVTGFQQNIFKIEFFLTRSIIDSVKQSQIIILI